MACLRSDRLLSDLALIIISWGQCLAGTSFPLLSDVKTPLPHLHPMTWLPSVRDFLAEIDCTLELANSIITDLQRENDSFIMDYAIRFTSKEKDLRILNVRRLYLGVLLISNIATCVGTHLALFAYQGHLSRESSVRGLTPYQDRHHDAAWELRRNMLSKMILSETDPNPLALQTTLGRWLITGSQTHRTWSAYHCSESKRLFVRATTSYQIYRHLAGNFVANNDHTILVPAMSVPVSVQTLLNGYTAICPYQPFVPPGGSSSSSSVT